MTKKAKKMTDEEIKDVKQAATKDECNKEVEVNPTAQLQEEVESLKREVATLKNAYAKAYADTENMKKRLQNDFEQRSKFQMSGFVKDLLPVLDNCERALAQATKDEAYRKGVEMIYSQLKNALEKEGVKEIDALNKKFDANFHQALMMEAKEGVEPNTVIEVLQKGYVIKERLLRPSMVKVSE